MDPHGVYVLYRADYDDVVGEVAHDLELELLPAGDALFDQGAADGARVEAVGHGAAEHTAVGDRGPSLAAEREAGADDEGKPDLRGELLRFGETTDRAAWRYLQADTVHGLGEELAVLGFMDRRDGCSEELDVEFIEDARLVQFDREVQGRLASEGGEQGIGAFAAQYLCDGLGCQGLDIGRVGDLGVSHYGGGVGVYEDHAVTLVAQGPAGLGAGVVELRSLSDHDRSRADDQDARDVVTPRHARPAPSLRYAARTPRRGSQNPSGPDSTRDGTARSRPSVRGSRFPRRCRRRGCGVSARRRPRTSPHLRRSRGSGSLSRCVQFRGS